MVALFFALGLILLASLAFQLGRRQAAPASGPRFHSLPGYYGIYAALWSSLPVLGICLLWILAEPPLTRHLVMSGLPADFLGSIDNSDFLYDQIRKLADMPNPGGTGADAVITRAADQYNRIRSIGLTALLALAATAGLLGLFHARRRIVPAMRARQAVEGVALAGLIICSCIAVLTTAGIVSSLFLEALRFFIKVPFYKFFFGLEWSPQTAIRPDQIGSSGSFGAVPVFAGTFMVSLIAMCIAAPVGLFSAIYTAEYASPRTRSIVKPLLEILAGVPTVVYGFFAALTVAPLLREFGTIAGLDVASESALAAGLVMGVMIIPFVSSLSDDVISAVPNSLREGSYGLGATHAETVRLVVLPAALPGIVSSLLLAVSRAIGETMIVVMAAGLAANLTANPFQAVTTVTVQIVTLLVGDQEFDSPKTLAAFALGLVLFLVTLGLNIVALRVVRKYREQYD